MLARYFVKYQATQINNAICHDSLHRQTGHVKTGQQQQPRTQNEQQADIFELQHSPVFQQHPNDSGNGGPVSPDTISCTLVTGFPPTPSTRNCLSYVQSAELPRKIQTLLMTETSL